MTRNGSNMWWLQHLKNFFSKNTLEKSARREPLYLDMLGLGLGQGPITMISIGSSDGVECLYALKKKGVDVTVHLLEPDPDNLAACQHHLSQQFPAAQQQIHFHRLAVSNQISEGSFFRNPASPNLNSASPTHEASVKLGVSYVTLDHFIETNHIQAPVIINMDIEGHEVEVLEGFLGFATVNSGVKILMEVHPHLYNEHHSLKRVLEKYFLAGYRPTYVESAGTPTPEKFKAKGLKPIKTANGRGLYTNLDAEFVLDVACHEHINKTNKHGNVTRKIVRSLLIEKIK